MEIKTQFCINQLVWFVCAETRRIKCERVKGIRVIFTSEPIYSTNGKTKSLLATGEYKHDLTLVYYDLESTSSEPEFMLYDTKEELLRILSNENNEEKVPFK